PPPLVANCQQAWNEHGRKRDGNEVEQVEEKKKKKECEEGRKRKRMKKKDQACIHCHADSQIHIPLHPHLPATCKHKQPTCVDRRDTDRNNTHATRTSQQRENAHATLINFPLL